MLHAVQYHKLVSEAVHGHCSDSLVMWDQRQCSIVGRGYWLGFLPTAGLQDGLQSCLGSLASILVNRTGGHTHQLGGASNLLF